MPRPSTVSLHIGPYVYRIHTNVGPVQEGIDALYARFPRSSDTDFADFEVGMHAHHRLRPGARRAIFRFDGNRLFAPVAENQAFATLEWCMNWVVSVHCNAYLKLHAGVVARNGQAVVMPGIPGAGKSTLCALLGLSGWRVLSDEHALIIRGTNQVVPLYRPVSLKNESIGLIRSRFPSAVFGPRAEDTHKGAVCHLKADSHPDTFATEPLPVAALLFPKYAADEPQKLTRAEKSRSFLSAAYHAFNYSLLGAEGFAAMRTLIDTTPCFNLSYTDPDWIPRAFDALLRESNSP